MSLPLLAPPVYLEASGSLLDYRRKVTRSTVSKSPASYNVGQEHLAQTEKELARVKDELAAISEL